MVTPTTTRVSGVQLDRRSLIRMVMMGSRLLLGVLQDGDAVGQALGTVGVDDADAAGRFLDQSKTVLCRTDLCRLLHVALEDLLLDLRHEDVIAGAEELL